MIKAIFVVALGVIALSAVLPASSEELPTMSFGTWGLDPALLSPEIDPGETVSGFVFANLDPGRKAYSVELLGDGIARAFEFVVAVPGFEADFAIGGCFAVLSPRCFDRNRGIERVDLRREQPPLGLFDLGPARLKHRASRESLVDRLPERQPFRYGLRRPVLR